MNKITGGATPGQVIGLLCQAFASGVAYILGGKKTTNQPTKKKIKQKNPQPKQKAILHTEEGTSQYYTMKR